MNKITKALSAFYAGQSGATAIEYGLIAGLISLSIVVGVTAMTNSIGGVFNYVVLTAGAVFAGG